jgi:hypothetical protein
MLKKDIGSITGAFLWIILGITLGVTFILIFYNIPSNLLDIFKVLSGFIIAGSVFVASQQFKFNRKQAESLNRWNKRQLAITQIHNSRKVLAEAISELHGTFEIIETKFKIPLVEIHDSMGIKLCSGKFIFHGEALQEDIQKIPIIQEGEDYNSIKFLENVQGREIKDAIIKYLGELEYIASGVNSNIFDKETVKKLMRYSFVRGYTIFYYYIKHLQQVHGNIKTYNETELLALEFMNDEETNNLYL